MKKHLLSILVAAGLSSGLQAQVYITEWQYNGSEFIEFTNLGSTAVDFTGWSFDDFSNTPGSFSLSDFGTVAAGESVILSEDSATNFRSLWNLSGSVDVIGGNTQNLGRNDTLYLYNNLNVIVDRLAFGDQDYPGSIRTDSKSGWTTFANLGDNTVGTWVLSGVGDAQGSYTSTSGGYVANPGMYAVPEPGALVLVSMGLGFLIWRLRRSMAQV